MFNKRENTESDTSNRPEVERPAPKTDRTAAAPSARSGTAASNGAASIGPSISIDGTLKGEEDLVVDGRIKGTVELKSHTLTVGSEGKLDAEVYAHTIFVEGTVNGDLYASERITIGNTARVQGNILSPRISLEDGAKFRGSIDMDADSEAFRKAFGKKSAGAGAATSNAASDTAGAKSPDSSQQGRPKGKPETDRQSAASGGAAGTAGSKTGTSAA